MSTGPDSSRPSCSTQLLTPDPPPPRRRRWPLVVLALVVVAAAAVAGVLVVSRDAGRQGPPHPSKWDARVQKYVDFVEKKRDLEFKHPVYVDFLPARSSRSRSPPTTTS